MNFWESLQEAARLAGAFHWIALVFMLAALILFLYVPAERTRIRTSVIFFAFSFIGLISMQFFAFGIEDGSSFDAKR